MSDIIKQVLQKDELVIYPTVGLIILSLTLVAIIAWTYRPQAKKDYEQQSMLTLD